MGIFNFTPEQLFSRLAGRRFFHEPLIRANGRQLLFALIRVNSWLPDLPEESCSVEALATRFCSNVLADTQRIGGYRQARIQAGGSRHKAAIDHVQIIDAAKSAKRIQRRRRGVIADANRTDSMRKSFDMMNVAIHRAGLM
jgi:hypothetical protein